MNKITAFFTSASLSPILFVLLFSFTPLPTNILSPPSARPYCSSLTGTVTRYPFSCFSMVISAFGNFTDFPCQAIVTKTSVSPRNLSTTNT